MDTLINNPKLSLYHNKVYDVTKYTPVNFDGDIVDEFGTNYIKQQSQKLKYDKIIDQHIYTNSDGERFYREIQYTTKDETQQPKILAQIKLPESINHLSDNQILEFLKGA